MMATPPPAAAGAPPPPGTNPALLELLNTERSYVKLLESVAFAFPAKIPDELLPAEEKQLLFGSLVELHETHEALTEGLQGVVASVQPGGEYDVAALARLFFNLPLVELYGGYCANYQTALQLLKTRGRDPVLADCLKQIQAEEGLSTPLHGLLLAPIQRMYKYPLLLKQLAKAVAATQRGHAELSEALELVSDAARQVDDIKREHELNRLLHGDVMVTRSRPLQERLCYFAGDLRELGPLVEAASGVLHASPHKEAKRQLFLFGAALLTCKLRPDGKYNFKDLFPLNSYKAKKESETMFSLVGLTASEGAHRFSHAQLNAATWVQRITVLGRTAHKLSGDLRREHPAQHQLRRLSSLRSDRGASGRAVLKRRSLHSETSSSHSNSSLGSFFGGALRRSHSRESLSESGAPGGRGSRTASPQGFEEKRAASPLNLEDSLAARTVRLREAQSHYKKHTTIIEQLIVEEEKKRGEEEAALVEERRAMQAERLMLAQEKRTLVAKERLKRELVVRAVEADRARVEESVRREQEGLIAAGKQKISAIEKTLAEREAHHAHERDVQRQRRVEAERVLAEEAAMLEQERSRLEHDQKTLRDLLEKERRVNLDRERKAEVERKRLHAENEKLARQASDLVAAEDSLKAEADRVHAERARIESELLREREAAATVKAQLEAQLDQQRQVARKKHRQATAHQKAREEVSKRLSAVESRLGLELEQLQAKHDQARRQEEDLQLKKETLLAEREANKELLEAYEQSEQRLKVTTEEFQRNEAERREAESQLLCNLGTEALIAEEHLQTVRDRVATERGSLAAAEKDLARFKEECHAQRLELLQKLAEASEGVTLAASVMRHSVHRDSGARPLHDSDSMSPTDCSDDESDNGNGSSPLGSPAPGSPLSSSASTATEGDVFAADEEDGDTGEAGSAGGLNPPEEGPTTASPPESDTVQSARSRLATVVGYHEALGPPAVRVVSINGTASTVVQEGSNGAAPDDGPAPADPRSNRSVSPALPTVEIATDESGELVLAATNETLFAVMKRLANMQEQIKFESSKVDELLSRRKAVERELVLARDQALLEATQHTHAIRRLRETERWLSHSRRPSAPPPERDEIRRALRRNDAAAIGRFDLGAHVLKALRLADPPLGLELQPHACGGYLWKLGAVRKTWRRRWFCFDLNEPEIVYFRDGTKAQRKGTIDPRKVFRAIVPSARPASPSKDSPATADAGPGAPNNDRTAFLVVTNARTFQLRADTAEAARVWVHLFNLIATSG